MQFEEMKKLIKKMLTPKRYRHSLNVVDMALKIAEYHDFPTKKIKTAAVLHDIAKDIDLVNSLKKADKLGLIIHEDEKMNSSLIHSKLGRAIAEKELGIKDDFILEAIGYHTTGKAKMCDLALIIYIADYIDPDKTHMKNTKLIKHTVKENLYEAALLVCISKMEYVIESMKVIHLDSIHFYNWLVKKMKKKNLSKLKV